MADETVEIAVSGASDDLVEVVGPCYDMGRESDRGEFCDCNIGAGVRQPPKKFALVDGDRRPIAAVYALYDGGWSFALAGSRTYRRTSNALRGRNMGLTCTGVWGRIAVSRSGQVPCVLLSVVDCTQTTTRHICGLSNDAWSPDRDMLDAGAALCSVG